MDVERVIFRIFADAAPYSRVVRDAENQMVHFARNATGLGYELTVPIVAATTAMVSLAAGIAGASAVAIKAASEFERTSIALEVMTGSATTATRLMDELAQFSVKTPFSFQDIHAGARQLRAFGFEVDQLLPTLQNLGNVVSGTGADFSRLVHAYGQVSAAGRLMGSQLREFVNAGVPLLEYLSRVLDKPKESIRGLVEEGKIGFPDVIRAFNMMNREGGLYFGMTDRLLGTTAGAWSAYTKTIEIGLRNIGLSFFRTFGVSGVLKEWTENLTAVTGDTERFDRFFSTIKDGLAEVWEHTRAVREWFNRNRELLEVIGKVALGLTSVWVVMGLLRLVISALMVPLLGMLAGWRALIVAISFLYNMEGIIELQSWPEMFKMIGDAIRGVAEDSEKLKLLTGIAIAATVAFGILRIAIITTGLALMAYRAIMLGVMMVQTGWTAFIGVLTALTNPLIFVVALVGALAAGFLYLSATEGDFSKQGQELIRMVGDLNGVFGTTWKGIQDAIKGHDLQGASEIAFKGIEVGFKRVVGAMKIEWYEFVQSMIQAIEKGWTSIEELMMVEAVKATYIDAPFFRQTKESRDKMNKEVEEVHKYYRDKRESTPREAVGQEWIDSALAPWKKANKELIDLIDTKMLERIEKRNREPMNIPLEQRRRGYVNEGLTKGDIYRGAAGGGLAAVLQMLPGNVMNVPPSGFARAGYEQPRIPFAITSEVIKFADEVVREMAKEQKGGLGVGTGPYSTFLRELGYIEQLQKGPLAQYGTGVPQALPGVVGPWATATFQPRFTQEQEQFAVANRYSVLERTANKTQDTYPRASLRGSAEAQDTINRAQYEQTSVLEDVRATLIRAEELERQQLEYVKQVNEAIKTLKREGLDIDKIKLIKSSGG